MDQIFTDPRSSIWAKLQWIQNSCFYESQNYIPLSKNNNFKINLYHNITMSIEKDYLITKMKWLKFTLITVSQGEKKKKEVAFCFSFPFHCGWSCYLHLNEDIWRRGTRKLGGVFFSFFFWGCDFISVFSYNTNLTPLSASLNSQSQAAFQKL